MKLSAASLLDKRVDGIFSKVGSVRPMRIGALEVDDVPSMWLDTSVDADNAVREAARDGASLDGDGILVAGDVVHMLANMRGGGVAYYRGHSKLITFKT
jgi:hypothetical protein